MLLRYVDRNSAIPVNLTQFRPAGGQEPLGSERDRIWRCTPSPWRDLLARLGGLRLGFHLAALDEVDLGIEDDHVTFLDAIAYFHLRPQIPCHGYFSNVGVTTLDHGDLQAVTIENDRLGRHQNRRRVMRNVKLDRAIGPGLQRAVWMWSVDFGQQRARTRIQRIGDSRHFAGESATG